MNLRQTRGLAMAAAMVMTATAAEKEITYVLPRDGWVSLAGYNANGQMVCTLRKAEPQPVEHIPASALYLKGGNSNAAFLRPAGIAFGSLAQIEAR